MRYACCTERRRDLLRESASSLNGIDYLEVRDDPDHPDEERQRTLFVHFVKPMPAGLTPNNVRIEGGERIRGITVEAIDPTGDAHVAAVRVDRAGDFSTYRLRLVSGVADDPADTPPDGIDPITAVVDFSFKVSCPSDFDCAPAASCSPAVEPAPAIDYLARDYASIRRLMLDRISTLIPSWTERNPADAGVALVELLASTGDHLTYAQDAIATEAYLDTARRRVSIRRHARLVDYPMHDGCNARAWVQVQVQGTAAPVLLPRGAKFLTTMPNRKPTVDVDSIDSRQLVANGTQVFESMYPVSLSPDHNDIPFYTWHDERCCLPRGATGATLAGHLPDLAPGDVLVFQERKGPLDGDPASADPAHRHAVRLQGVRAWKDPETRTTPLADPIGEQEITEISWHIDDALPFPLCISSQTDDEHGDRLIEDVSVALGNIVLVDHGLTLADGEPLGTYPASTMRYAASPGTRCERDEREPVSVRFRPALQQGPVTQAGLLPGGRRDPDRTLECSTEPVDFDHLSAAAAAFQVEMRTVLPEIVLTADGDDPWQPRRDLLDAGGFARVFVVEVENDGRATIRFGDGRYGATPREESGVTAHYRIGNGAAGNVGAGTITHLVNDDCTAAVAGAVPGGSGAIGNPMPARGGQDPESIEHVRQRAPVAFRTQERAVTPEDYARAAERFPGVQRAVARFRWTGSWRTVFLTVDRVGGVEIDADFERRLRQFLERFRLAGHDLEVDAPHYVPLELALTVCVEAHAFRRIVRDALLAELGNRTLPDGRRGIFHPDNLTFGQTIYLSPIHAAAQAIPGVQSVEIATFGRLGTTSVAALDDYKLEMGPLEIAQLDNDPNFPDRGIVTLTLKGGR